MKDILKVKEIMTTNIGYCTPETSLEEVARLMVEDDCGAIPVLENKESFKPVGIITDRDIVVRSVAKGVNPLTLKAKDCMTQEVYTIDMNDPVEICYDIMIEHQVRRMVVVDEDGRCRGMLSQADIATKAADADTASVVERISQLPEVAKV